MDPLRVRLARVRSAIVDPTSYRIFWSMLVDEFKPPPKSVEFVLDESQSNPVSGVDTRSSIPKIIFQTWKTHSNLPPNYAHWATTFLKQNQTYRYVLWDDYDNRRFIESKFSWFLPAYDRYPREIFRADLIRFFFLYSFGGFYADLDAECLRPLEDLRNVSDVLLGRMGRNKQFEQSIPNAIMASKPRQGFWLLAIALAMERLTEAIRMNKLDELGPDELTGPVLLKTAADYYVSHSSSDIQRRAAPVLSHFEGSEYSFGKLSILPSHIWYPISWNNPAHQIFRRRILRRQEVLTESSAKRRFRNSYVVNYWASSWKDPPVD
jgi:inositol phosphorylceramide mannosyltransferase catalytic subunit